MGDLRSFSFFKGPIQKQTSERYSKAASFHFLRDYRERNQGAFLLGSCYTLPVLLIRQKKIKIKNGLSSGFFNAFSKEITDFSWVDDTNTKGWVELAALVKEKTLQSSKTVIPWY